MLTMETAAFAGAGLAAAVGPLVIHLLNRRRFRPVPWAAMEFLREALQRSRKMLHLRDLLLLVLRALALALFGAALARPYYRGDEGWASVVGVGSLLALAALTLGGALVVTRQRSLTAAGPRGLATWPWSGLLLTLAGGTLLGGLWWPQLTGTTTAADGATASQRRALQEPVHAVLVIDNSRSMGCRDGADTRLKTAQSRALTFLQQLPAESRVTVIPVAGSRMPTTLDAYRGREEARRAIEQIGLVDTSDQPREVIEDVREALGRVNDLPTKRIAWLTDFQDARWSQTDLAGALSELPEVQLAPLSEMGRPNVSVRDFMVEDGLASIEVPTRLIARIEAGSGSNGGSEPADEPGGKAAEGAPIYVQARLLIDGVEAGSQGLELAPGQSREIEFTHQFQELTDPEQPLYAVARLEISVDRPEADWLASDNQIDRVIPVVAALPVVFIDQYGREENVARNQLGETYALRHLLAPRSATETGPRALIQSRHIRIDELDRDTLADARLVVLAGIDHPGDSVPLLREYVLQGGPLVILAGAGFDPDAWTADAWRDGAGLLPGPLLAEAIGIEPEESTGDLKPFFLSPASLQHDYFLIPGEDPETLESLFATTPFFKAVQANLSAEMLATLERADRELLSRRVKSSAGSPPTSAAQAATNSNDGSAGNDGPANADSEPRWWKYRPLGSIWDPRLSDDAIIGRQQPRPIGRFTGVDAPFFIERSLGAGKIVFCTTGVTSNWNLLRQSGAIYVFHRVLGQLIEQTLPVRNSLAGERLVYPVPALVQGRYALLLPDGERQSLSLEPLQNNVPGVRLGRPLSAGIYRVERVNDVDAAEASETGNGADPSDSSATEVKGDRPASAIRPDTVVVAAVQADPLESQLTLLSLNQLRERFENDNVRVLTPDEALHLEGVTQRGRGLWKWLMVAVLVCLTTEMLTILGHRARTAPLGPNVAPGVRASNSSVPLATGGVA